MTLSTSLIFSQAAQQMRKIQDSITRTQTQISTGLQLTTPSDNAATSVAIANLNSALARQQSYLDTIGTVGDQLSFQQQAITASQKDLNSLSQLALQAASGTVNPSDLKNIASQMSSLRADLAARANSRDVNGNFVFSGSRSGTTPFAPGAGGTTTYQGDQTAIAVAINDQESVNVDRPGTQVFVAVSRTSSDGSTGQIGFFQSIDDLIAATTAGNNTGITQGIGELSTLSDGINAAQASVANQQNVVTEQQTMIQQTQLQLKTSLSRIQDSDYTTTITDLQKESLSLQASQQSFAQISQLSLFNFLK
jgi:flagellar hook-associated protein 3 FlgL